MREEPKEIVFPSKLLLRSSVSTSVFFRNTRLLSHKREPYRLLTLSAGTVERRTPGNASQTLWAGSLQENFC